MPIPANAIFWIGVVAWISAHGYIGHLPMALLIVVISLLMVDTRMKMFSLKFKNFNFRENVRRYAIIIAAILFILFEGIPGLAWTIVFYIILSLLPTRE
jgi:CDP-diacylglycerol--serine O-phosphatidyltransferase